MPVSFSLIIADKMQIFTDFSISIHYLLRTSAQESALSARNLNNRLLAGEDAGIT
jgi:hypothetical protein